VSTALGAAARGLASRSLNREAIAIAIALQYLLAIPPQCSTPAWPRGHCALQPAASRPRDRLLACRGPRARRVAPSCCINYIRNSRRRAASTHAAPPRRCPRAAAPPPPSCRRACRPLWALSKRWQTPCRYLLLSAVSQAWITPAAARSRAAHPRPPRRAALQAAPLLRHQAGGPPRGGPHPREQGQGVRVSGVGGAPPAGGGHHPVAGRLGLAAHEGAGGRRRRRRRRRRAAPCCRRHLPPTRGSPAARVATRVHRSLTSPAALPLAACRGWQRCWCRASAGAPRSRWSASRPTSSPSWAWRRASPPPATTASSTCSSSCRARRWSSTCSRRARLAAAARRRRPPPRRRRVRGRRRRPAERRAWLRGKARRAVTRPCWTA
jgi:hypothetical protein